MELDPVDLIRKLVSFAALVACEALILSRTGLRRARFYLGYALALNALTTAGLFLYFRYTVLGRRCYEYCLINVEGLLGGYALLVLVERTVLSAIEDLPWYSCLLIALIVNFCSAVVWVVAPVLIFALL